MSGRINSAPLRGNSVSSWGSRRTQGTAKSSVTSEHSYVSASTNFHKQAKTPSVHTFSRATSRASTSKSNPYGYSSAGSKSSNPSIHYDQPETGEMTVLSANSESSLPRYSTHNSRASSRGSTATHSIPNSASTYHSLDTLSLASSNHTYNRRASLPDSITSIQEAFIEEEYAQMPDVETVSTTRSKTSSLKDFMLAPSTRNSSTFPSPRNAKKRSSKSETVLRKYFENGNWFEEAQEVTTRVKRNGAADKTFKTNVRQLEADEAAGMEKSEDIIKQLNLETDLNNMRVIQQGKGMMQDDQEEFSKDVLQTINKYRYQHGVKALKIGQQITEYARSWARTLAKTGDIRSRNKVDLGDAIYVKRSPNPWEKVSGSDVIDKWYEEISNFNFAQPSEVSSGNFSQIVWKNTKNIGVGVDRSKDGLQTYVVVFFHPKGNTPGAFREQVPPVGGFRKLKLNDKGIKIPSLPDPKEDFPRAVLKAHNFYRLKHSALPLILDATLSKFSQEWAEKLASKDKLQHRSNNIYGENIYRTSFDVESIRDIPGSEPVSFWYEKKPHNYNYKLEPKDLKSASFTQLIWTDTRDLGVGVAKSKTNQFYVVANYNPPGNLLGQFTKKVLPVKWNAA